MKKKNNTSKIQRINIEFIVFEFFSKLSNANYTHNILDPKIRCFSNDLPNYEIVNTQCEPASAHNACILIFRLDLSATQGTDTLTQQ